MDIKETLSHSLHFFSEQALKEEIVDHGKLVRVGPGTSILTNGSYVKTIPVLVSGLVKVIREEQGKEILIYYIYPQEGCIVSVYCGMNEVKSHVKAIAEDETTALILPSRLLADWQRKYPSFNQFILNLYQKRFDDVLNAFNALAFQSLDQRLLSFLTSKSEALKDDRIYITHQELADEMGTARETVSRLLKKLEVDEKVKLHRGWIELITN